MTITTRPNPLAATSSLDHHITHTLNGTEMKNLGISNGLLFFTMVSGLVAWTSRVAPVRQHAGKDLNRAAHDHPERGDVPGWVMITLMSAVLVAGLLALAGPALETMFNQAMDKVGK